MEYSEDTKSWGVYIPSTESVVFCAHVMLDETIPNRQFDYFREINEMAVKFASDEIHLWECKYKVNTHFVYDEVGLLYRVNRVGVRKGVIVAAGHGGKMGVEDKTPICIADVERMTKEVDSGDRSKSGDVLDGSSQEPLEPNSVSLGPAGNASIPVEGLSVEQEPRSTTTELMAIQLQRQVWVPPVKSGLTPSEAGNHVNS